MKLLSSRVGRIVNRWKLLAPLAIVALSSSPVVAADEAAAAGGPTEQVDSVGVFIIWILCMAGSIAALWYAKKFYDWMVQQDEGDEVMVKIAGHVRDGANAYV